MSLNMETAEGVPSKGDYQKALKKKASEHYASMAKGFHAVTPENLRGEIGPSAPKLYFPDFRIKLKDIPEAKKWEVGQKYEIELSVEMSAMTNRKGEEPEVQFTVLGIKSDAKPDKKEE